MVKVEEFFNIIADIFNHIPKEAPLSLIDIGCTTGYYYEIIKFFTNHQITYHGIDYNNESISLAKKYYPNIQLNVGDATNLQIDDKLYDIVFLSGVIEHIPEYQKAINEICRISKRYIILHRIWLTNNNMICTKGTQYFVPVIRNQYNKIDFFNLFTQNSFKIIYETPYYDTNNKSYILQRF